MKSDVRMPNFFIVGAAKSGTSSLANYLGQHPEIFISGIKEPAFYLDGAGFTDEEEYRNLFRPVKDEKAIGEGSTGYLFDERSAERIKANHPDAKIIIMLRNPVGMSYSYWQYMQIDGDENCSFEEATSPDQIAYRHTEAFRQKCKNWWANYLYLERAQYSSQVERYINTFGRDNVRIYIFEEFIKDPLRVCQDIYSFINVSLDFVPDMKRVNEGGALRSVWLRDAIYNREYKLLRKIISPKWREKIRLFVRDINKTKRTQMAMSPEMRSKLQEFFAADIAKVEKLLDRAIPEWGGK